MKTVLTTIHNIGTLLQKEYHSCMVFVQNVRKLRQQKQLKLKISASRVEHKERLAQKVKSYQQKVKLSTDEQLAKQLENELMSLPLTLSD